MASLNYGFKEEDNKRRRAEKLREAEKEKEE